MSQYELGKWHYESGCYKTWLSRQLADFKRHHTMIDYEEINLTTGGILLLAEGSPKELDYP